jgi:glucose dehydrogenase
MKIQSSLAAVSLASLLCTGTSTAQQAPAAGQTPAGLGEGMDPAIARRMAVEPATPTPFVVPPASNEWLTWGYDQERTGWNRAETMLSPKTVGKLIQLWSIQLAVPVDKYVLSTMTAPVIVSGVATASGPADILFVLGANDTLFAVDAGSGKQIWSKSFPNPQAPKKPKEWLCPGTVNDTPTIDKARGIVFLSPVMASCAASMSPMAPRN